MKNCWLIFIAILSFGCSLPVESRFQPESWNYSHLRYLDPLDASIPQGEIVALYVRRTNATLQIRLDLLDLDNQQTVDIRILLVQAGRAVEVTLPSQGEIAIREESLPLDGAKIQAVRDPVFDTVSISIGWEALRFSGVPFKAQAALLSPETGAALDSTPFVASDTLPPPPVLYRMVFWDTFEASTPAQALKRWDGAHTGPLGSRHGLRYLLAAAQNAATPVTLLDLQRPEVRSALDYLGVIPHLNHLAQQKLLSNNFVGPAPKNGGLWLTADSFQAAPEGLSIETKTALAQAAQHGESLLAVLGGNFQQSTWGDPALAAAGFAYLQAHPWLRPAPFEAWIDPQPSERLNLSPFAQQVEQAIEASPASAFREMARKLFASATRADMSLPEDWIRLVLGRAGHWLAAARWEHAPTALYDCTADVDWDSEAECLLANEHLFVVFEADEGLITLAAAHTENGVHQFMGSSLEITPRGSDPLGWDLTRGLRADPRAIIGSCADGDLLGGYMPEPSPGAIRFVQGARSKTFRLEQDRLTIVYEPAEAQTTLAVLLDPWARFESGWGDRFQGGRTPAGWAWGLEDQIKIEVITEGGITAQSFYDSRRDIQSPEDPNFNYPLGHFLPFGMSLARIEMAKEITIWVRR